MPFESIDHLAAFCRLNDERPQIKYPWPYSKYVSPVVFTAHRKAILRDELYAPSSQRLTRDPPLLYMYICILCIPLFIQLAPRRALAKQYRTLSPILGLQEESWFTAHRSLRISLSSALRGETFLSRLLSGRIASSLSKVAVLSSFCSQVLKNKRRNAIDNYSQSNVTFQTI